MNASEQDPSPAKFVVDEDWKVRAQAEKEALQKAREQGQATTGEKAPATAPPAPTVDESKATSEASPAADEAPFDFPPASFAMLVGELGTQAIMALQEAEQNQGVKRTNLLGAARHAIDTLDILEDKCRGNLSGEETQILARYLQATRLAYVQVTSRKS